MNLPSALSSALTEPAYVTRMLMLPNGDLLLNTSDNQLWEYTPDGSASVPASWVARSEEVTSNAS